MFQEERFCIGHFYYLPEGVRYQFGPMDYSFTHVIRQFPCILCQ